MTQAGTTTRAASTAADIAATPPAITVALDVGDIDEACRFWRALLGFEVVATARAGTPIESRSLRCPAVPEVELRLRSCWPRPPVGTTVGALRGLEFWVDNPDACLRAMRQELGLAEPETAAEEAEDDVRTVTDPSGYRVRLIRRP